MTSLELLLLLLLLVVVVTKLQKLQVKLFISLAICFLAL